MLITQLKQKSDILSAVGEKAIIIQCQGCAEVYFPENEANKLQNDLLESGVASAAIVSDRICDPDNLELFLAKHMDKIDSANSALVFACGIGVQTVGGRFPGMPVFAACDTIPLPGFQGVTPLEHDCALCGECHLNSTGGICPITSCAKSLVNGQCGGADNGMCEVDKDMECGWVRIHRRLVERNERMTPGKAIVRNYSASN